MNKNIFQTLKLIALALVLSLGISYVSAWTAPTVTPPGGNVAAPINVSNTTQTKSGNLGASWLYAYSYRDAGDSTDTYFMKPNGDSKLKNILVAQDVCISGTTICLSTVSGTPGPQGLTGATGATGPAGSTGTGLSGFLAPLNGKTASCVASGSYGVATFYATVSGGAPYVRIVYGVDSGNIPGDYYERGLPATGYGAGSVSMTMGGVHGFASNSAYSGTCMGSWPTT